MQTPLVTSQIASRPHKFTKELDASSENTSTHNTPFHRIQRNVIHNLFLRTY